MSSLTDTSVVTATGGLVELGYSEITSAVLPTATTAATSNTVISDLTVVCDGSPILVEFYSNQVRPNNTAGTDLKISLYEDGSEETREWGRFYNGVANYDNKPCYLSRRLTPSAGSHTYKVTAFVSSGTGYIGAGSGGTGEAPAFLRVSKIVEATQWPAVTTGTIICTSSTRPASPFEGQKIYETDTKKEMTYDGAGWYAFNQVIGYASSTSSFSTSATHTTLQDNGLTTGSIPYADNRRIRVTLYARPYPNGGLQRMEFRVLAGSDTAGYWALGTTGLSASEAPYKCMTNVWTTTSSGSAVFKAQVKASVSNTQVTDYYSVSDGLARSLTIEDIGPA